MSFISQILGVLSTYYSFSKGHPIVNAAWDLYEVKAKMMRQPTVLYSRVDEGQKRLEAIASSLDIEYKDVPTVWQLLNNTYMVNFHCLLNFFDESPRLRLEKEYPDHLKIRALVGIAPGYL